MDMANMNAFDKSFVVLNILCLAGLGLVGCQFVPVCEMDKTGSPCICRSNAGMIDLTVAANTQGHASFAATLPTGDVVKFNPCYPFSEGGCRNVSVCLITQKGQYLALGTQDTAGFSSNADTATIYLTFHATGTDRVVRKSQVLLTCQPEVVPGIFTVLGESSNTWTFNLQSMYACAAGYPPPLQMAAEKTSGKSLGGNDRVQQSEADSVVKAAEPATKIVEEPRLELPGLVEGDTTSNKEPDTDDRNTVSASLLQFYRRMRDRPSEKRVLFILMLGCIAMVGLAISHLHKVQINKRANIYVIMKEEAGSEKKKTPLMSKMVDAHCEDKIKCIP